MHKRDLGRRSLESLARALAERPGLSVLDGDGLSERGRYSYLACDPVRVIEGPPSEPLAALDTPHPPIAGADFPRDIGYVAYDAAFPGRALEGGIPAARFARYDAVVRLDEVKGEAEILGTTEDAVLRLESAARAAPSTGRARLGALREEDPRAHLRAIERGLERIAAGDLYQINLARRWEAALDGSPLELYLAMRRSSPVPLGFFQVLDGAAVLARTMETFLELDPATRTLRTRPIKGTRARGSDDAASACALLEDPKEHAEHAMVVDLMRNDLGRIAETGSVEVEAPFFVEPYARLLHLVSVVRARVPADTGLRDIFEATFPPGSVTGTPKIAAVRSIDELESSRRGVYCGALGHVRHDGGAHFAVGIRTAITIGGRVLYHAGGGIVAASDPARELEETRLKARVLTDAAEDLARPNQTEEAG